MKVLKHTGMHMNNIMYKYIGIQKREMQRRMYKRLLIPLTIYIMTVVLLVK